MIDEDLAEFFVEGELGTVATIGTTDVVAVFDHEYYESPAAGPGVEGLQAVLTVNESDLPAGYRAQSVTINTDTYKVVSDQPDGTGLTRLVLALAGDSGQIGESIIGQTFVIGL